MIKFLLGTAVGVSLYLQFHNLCISISNHSKLKKIMSKQDQINASLQQLDDATNEIASDLETLRDQVKAGTVSDESLTKLDSAVSRLKALGADETNPIPTTDTTADSGNTGTGAGTGDGSGAGAGSGEGQP